MPHLDGVTGEIYYRSRLSPESEPTVVLFHGFGEDSGLYHRYAAQNAAGVDLWALDEIGHGLSVGDRAVIGSIEHLVENAEHLVSFAEHEHPRRPVD